MPNSLRSYVVIPARLGSTRLPQKMLLAQTGKTLIQHTYENACNAKLPSGVVVATDHGDIARAVRQSGGQAVLTSDTCASGTDRVAEVATALPDADIIVNVQGDEPELDASGIDQVIRLLTAHPEAPMATLAAPLRNPALLTNPACVKVVFDDAGRALYFSRSPIPYVRDPNSDPLNAEPPVYHQHLGIYAYRRRFLLELAKQKQSPLEKIEMLEQLRVLQMGYTIQVGVTPHAMAGIDTAEDYAAFVNRWHLRAAA